MTRFKPGDAVFASIFDLGMGALAEVSIGFKPAAWTWTSISSGLSVGRGISANAI